MNKPVVVLFSGGLDSLAGLLHAREKYGPENTLALYCDVGHRYAEKEIAAVRTICRRMLQEFKIERRLTLTDMEASAERNAIIPYRNSYFILLAAMHTPPEGGTVIIANVIQGETSTWDRRSEFNEAMQNLLEFADPRRVKIEVPHSRKTKTEIVKYIVDHGSTDLIFDTVGCYTEGEGNCGECNSCFRSWVAMTNADISSPERRFKKNPLDWEEGIRGYVKRMVSGEYEQVRVDETFAALAKMDVLDKYRNEIYAIDLDGTLADTGPGKFSADMLSADIQQVYREATPIQKNIDRVNKLYDEGSIIIIHTARFSEDRDLTEKWLADHNVKYHRLALNKIRADFYVDDKNLSVEKFIEEIKVRRYAR